MAEAFQFSKELDTIQEAFHFELDPLKAVEISRERQESSDCEIT